MAKKHQKYEGDQKSCMRGFISIFDLRHGPSTRRLLAESKKLAGSGHSITHTILPVNAQVCEAEEHKVPMAVVPKTSVKEGSKICANDEMDATKCLIKTYHEVPEETPLDFCDLDVIIQELAMINQGSTECLNHDQTATVVEEKLVAAIDLLTEQRLSNSKHFGEGKPEDVRSDDKIGSSSFFRRRSKSLGSYLSVGGKDFDVQSISLQSRDKMDEKVSKKPNVLHFSFAEVTKRLRQAARRQKSFGGFKRDEPVGRSKDQVCSIYVEARRHIAQMMNNRDENEDSLTCRQLPKSLGRILSLPEYATSQCSSPRKDSDDDLLTTSMMRLSSDDSEKDNLNGFVQEKNNDKECCSKVQSLDEHSVISEVSTALKIEAGLSHQEEKRGNDCSESSSILVSGDALDGDIIVDYEESSSRCSEDSTLSIKSDSFGEVQEPNSLPVEDSERIVDKTERTSPVSVLETSFTDDDFSPASAISQPVEKEVQPRRLHFEEPSPATAETSLEEDIDSAFEYVEALVLSSGLNWDELLSKCLSLSDILDSSLYDDIAVFTDQPHRDQKLLFDSTNEVLKDLCESYFRSFKHNSVHNGMDLVHEVWEQIELHLFNSPILHSVDELLKRDMGGFGNWINLQSHIEFIIFEMGEVIFDELVQDTLMSVMCVEDL